LRSLYDSFCARFASSKKDPKLPDMWPEIHTTIVGAPDSERAMQGLLKVFI